MCVGELALAHAVASAGNTVFCVGQGDLPDVCALSMAATVTDLKVFFATKTPVYDPAEAKPFFGGDEESGEESEVNDDVWGDLAASTGLWEQISHKDDYGTDWLLTVYALMSAAVREGRSLSYYLAVHESVSNPAYTPRDKRLPPGESWQTFAKYDESTGVYTAVKNVKKGLTRLPIQF